MLPNRMQLSQETENQLKKLKNQTGITPNVSARIAFFRSIETSYRYDSKSGYKTDGSLTLDKITWLGKTCQATELLIKSYYPNLDSKERMKAWASHVENGSSSFKNSKSVNELFLSIKYK